MSLTSGARFSVTYAIAGGAAEAAAAARELCIEQTVEYPEDLIVDPAIRADIFGRLEGLVELAPGRHEARISYAVETVGAELTQLLNVVFGNSSLKPGLRVTGLDLGPLAATFRGPRFGVAGLRARAGRAEGVLLCTALKPLGLDAAALADLAYELGRGGVDLIKDDHGLADQPLAPFAERVERCAAAVARAAARTGRPCLYAPNVTAPLPALLGRARLARRLGAGALLVAPGLAGFDALRALAADGDLGLPLLCHPALLGSFTVAPDAGMAPFVTLGQLPRLAGADAAIFPSYGGRFSFTPADCRAIVAGATGPMAGLAPMMPAPAGGMSLARIPEIARFYGPDTLLRVGGDLHHHGSVARGCQRFRELVESAR
ncbi:MAG TPA: RuBisCO large subunit C-terminal-like domain-containing protein [Polyangia bacterium]